MKYRVMKINETYIYYLIFSDFVGGSTEEEKKEILSGKINEFRSDIDKNLGNETIQICYELYFDKKGKCYKIKYDIYVLYGDEEIEIEDSDKGSAEMLKKEITDFLILDWYEV